MKIISTEIIEDNLADEGEEEEIVQRLAITMDNDMVYFLDADRIPDMAELASHY